MRRILDDFSPWGIIILIIAIGWALSAMIGAATSAGMKYVCPHCRSEMVLVRP